MVGLDFLPGNSPMGEFDGFAIKPCAEFLIALGPAFPMKSMALAHDFAIGAD